MELNMHIYQYYNGFLTTKNNFEFVKYRYDLEIINHQINKTIEELINEPIKEYLTIVYRCQTTNKILTDSEIKEGLFGHEILKDC